MITLSGVNQSESLHFYGLDLPIISNGLNRVRGACIKGTIGLLTLHNADMPGHARRVAVLSVQLARTLSVAEREVLYLQWGALLHDIGKLRIPQAILDKPGALDAHERAIIERHPLHGYDLLAAIPFLEPALDVVLYHHERWDGTGYPDKLRGADIPLSARICAVVDTWDALCSDRAYRQAWPAPRAWSYIFEHSGTCFDPEIVQAFSDMMSAA